MKKVTAILIGLLSITVCHAQSKDTFKKALGAEVEILKKMKKELADKDAELKELKKKVNAYEVLTARLRKELKGANHVDGWVPENTQVVLNTAEDLLLHIKHVKQQDERKTETLQSIAKIFGEKELMVTAKSMKDMSKVSQKILEEKMRTIKMDVQKAIVFEARVKDLEKALKAAQGK